MRSFTVEERRARLARRHFLSPLAESHDLTGTTGAMIGWHATDPATPYLSLWSRMPGFTIAELDRAMYEKRSLVKHLAMRRTLWLVDAAHLPMLQPTASDRVADTEERRLIADVEKAGIAPDGRRWLDVARAAVLGFLRDHPHASAVELRRAGFRPQRQRRSDRVGQRPDRRRLVPGFRRTGPSPATGGPRPGRSAGAAATRTRPDRVA